MRVLARSYAPRKAFDDFLSQLYTQVDYAGGSLKTPGLLWIEEYDEWPSRELTGRILEVIFVPQGERAVLVPQRVLWNV